MLSFPEIENVSRGVLDSLAITLAIMVVALLLNVIARLIVRRRRLEPRQGYFVRKLLGFGIWTVAVIAIVLVWSPFAGRLSLILALITAGVAFASQEAIGALFGWVNIIVGGIYSVGERVEVAGVRGTVVDISPMRTQVLENGDRTDSSTWISGRQFTGRLVSISNKETFTAPVYNYSRWFSYIWEEFTVVVPYSDDWRRAEEIVHAVVLDHVGEHIERGRQALLGLRHRFAVGEIRTDPETFMRLGDSGVEFSTRFLVPLNGSRRLKSRMARGLLEAFEAEGIGVAFTTSEIEVSHPIPVELRDLRAGSSSAQ